MGNKKHRFEPLTEKEIDMLISNCKHPDLRDLIMILRETGCRVREILNLRTEDIHFRDGYALLHVKHDNKRKGGIRHVPVFECLPIVRRLVRDQKNGQPLFRYNYIAQYRRLKAMMKRLGINKDATFHIFRHQAATRLLRNDMPPQILKKMMGWRPDSDMLDIYEHLACDDVIQHLKRINGQNGRFAGPFVFDVYN